jgi:hypothetical protein
MEVADAQFNVPKEVKNLWDTLMRARRQYLDFSNRLQSLEPAVQQQFVRITEEQKQLTTALSEMYESLSKGQQVMANFVTEKAQHLLTMGAEAGTQISFALEGIVTDAQERAHWNAEAHRWNQLKLQAHEEKILATELFQSQVSHWAEQQAARVAFLDARVEELQKATPTPADLEQFIQVTIDRYHRGESTDLASVQGALKANGKKPEVRRPRAIDEESDLSDVRPYYHLRPPGPPGADDFDTPMGEAPGGGGRGGGRGGGQGGGAPPPDDDSSSEDDDLGLPKGEHMAPFKAIVKRLQKENKALFKALTGTQGFASRTVKKPKMTAPKTFKGDQGEDFDSWYRQVRNYFAYSDEEFPDEYTKITYCSGLLGGRALQWFHSRQQALRKERSIDTWRGFTHALRQRFKDPFAAERALLKLQTIPYHNDIAHYLALKRQENERVGLEGVAWRNALKEGLPDDIIQRVSQYPAPPADDAEFEDRLQTCGRNHEDYKRETALRAKGKSSNAPQNSSQRHGQGSSTSKKEESGDRPKKPMGTAKGKSRQSQGNGFSNGGNKNEVIHTDIQEALKGIPKAVIEDRKKRDVCLKCDTAGHRVRFCRKATNLGTSNSRVAGAKRKQSSEEEETPFHSSGEKKRKTAALMAIGSRAPSQSPVPQMQPTSSVAAAGFGRIYELSEDEEVDFS